MSRTLISRRMTLAAGVAAVPALYAGTAWAATATPVLATFSVSGAQSLTLGLGFKPGTRVTLDSTQNLSTDIVGNGQLTFFTASSSGMQFHAKLSSVKTIVQVRLPLLVDGTTVSGILGGTADKNTVATLNLGRGDVPLQFGQDFSLPVA